MEAVSSICEIMEFFLFTIASRLALRTAHPPIQGVLGVKRPGLEGDLSPSCSTDVKNASWSYNFTPPIRLHGLVLN